MSEYDETMLDGETLSEQEAAKEVNGEMAATSVKASIEKSASKKQGARKGDKLGTEDDPGVLPGAGNGSDTPGQTEKLEAYGGKMKKESDCEDDEDEMPKKKKMESIDFSDDINALCESEATLSESFKEKALLIFEAAFASKVSAEVERLEESYEEALVEELQGIRTELVEQVDSYLNYVVEQWMSDNELAIETGLRADIAESFMKSLHGVFAEHYVEVPESKVDLVDDLAQRVQDLEEALNESMEDNIKLTEEVVINRRSAIISENSANLTMAQVEKLKQLSEAIAYDSDEDFSNKVSTIKESYFGAKKVVNDETAASSEQLNEDVSERMSQYLSAIKKSL